jgi:hypothetical protein
MGGNDVNMTRYDKYNVSGLPLGTGYYVALIVAGNSSGKNRT